MFNVNRPGFKLRALVQVVGFFNGGLNFVELTEKSKYTLRTKSTSKYLLWCFSLSQIGDLCQSLEGPISIYT